MIFSFPLSPILSVFADLLRRYQCPLLKQQLKELDTFLGEGENIGELQSYTLDHYEIELEPQMPRFWKEVYNL